MEEVEKIMAECEKIVEDHKLKQDESYPEKIVAEWIKQIKDVELREKVIEYLKRKNVEYESKKHPIEVTD